MSYKKDGGSMKKKVLVALIILLFAFFGIHSYMTERIKSTLSPIVVKDDLLFEQHWKNTGESHTADEWINILNSEIEQRKETILAVSSLYPYVYRNELQMYVDLLKKENEYAVVLRSILTEENAKVLNEKNLDKVHRIEKRIEDLHKQNHSNIVELIRIEEYRAKELSSILPKRNILPLLKNAASQK
jgi:hypothetical protein